RKLFVTPRRPRRAGRTPRYVPSPRRGSPSPRRSGSPRCGRRARRPSAPSAAPPRGRARSRGSAAMAACARCARPWCRSTGSGRSGSDTSDAPGSSGTIGLGLWACRQARSRFMTQGADMSSSMCSALRCGFRQSLLRLAVAALAAIAVVPTTGAIADDAGRGRIMTRNMFLGSSFTAIAAATNLPTFVQAVTTTFLNIQASKPAERAAALADEIAKARPDFVALQEAWIVRTGTRPATDVVVDQLQLLLDALAPPRLHYATVLIVPNLDVEAPTLLGFDGRLTDRNAIIARRDGDSNEMKLSNVQVQELLINQVTPTPIPGLSVIVMRGWGSVDVTMHGGTFRL